MSPRSYLGPLLDHVGDRELVDTADLPCGGDWQHSAASHNAISAIVHGRHVQLIRRMMLPGNDEIPGVVSGHCYGSSHNHTGAIYLAIQTDDGEAVAVDVSNPLDWSWEVH